MKYKKKILLSGLMVLFCLAFTTGNFAINLDISETVLDKKSQDSMIPLTSTGTNEEIIDSILEDNIQAFQSEGYFPGLYEPSIHATFYAVYILYMIGREYYIDPDSIIDFIMAHYDNNTGLFEDDYSRRYLDSDFDPWYFPLTTLLEVNCYAILMLDIFGALDMINEQDMIDFIWSCFNPDENGFIGRPYDISLDEGFKIPTLDNNYYAVMTLDLLLNGDWSDNATERNELIIFINERQNGDGSFENDPDSILQTSPYSEPNPISGYQALKILDLFSAGDTIDLDGFRTYLESLFEPASNYFKISPYSGIDIQSELVASAICVEIADIITLNIPEYSRTATLQFVVSNRNALGTWNDGLQGNYHELWYTYFIIRALSDSSSLSLVNAQDRDEIAEGITHYYDGIGGYFLMSNDFTPIKTIHSTVNSLMAENRYNELSLLEKEAIYDSLINAHKTTVPGHSTFFYCIGLEEQSGTVKTRPLDFFYGGTQEHLRVAEFTITHKNTYLALDTLNKMMKLDDLNDSIDVNLFIDTVINSQLLDPGYDECGGFAFHDSIPSSMSDEISKIIYFEQSYYALKVVELLTEFQEKDIYSAPIDYEAYISYIYRNIQQTPTMTWIQPENVNDVETILKNTYYAIDAMQILNVYSLDNQKILNYLSANINYNNIQNIYYCYKIIHALNLENIIDYDRVNQLIPLIYDESLHEFYLTSERIEQCQEALWWVCEMANSDVVKAEVSYDNPLYLSTHLNIFVAVKSLIYELQSQYYNVYFESEYFGNVPLVYQDSCYSEEIFVDFDADYYPQISGNISVYRGGTKKTEVSIIINTIYETEEVFLKTLRADGGIDFFARSQLIIDGEYLPAGLYGFNVRVDIYKENHFLESHYMISSEMSFPDRTEYTLNYTPDEEGKYLFKMYYENPLDKSAILVLNASLSYKGSESSMMQVGIIALPGAIVISIILAVSSSGVIVFSSKKRGIIHKKFNR